MPDRPLKLAVLVSGSGATLQNFVDRIAAGVLDADVRVVVGSRPGLVGLDRAAAAGLPHEVVDRRGFGTSADFSRRVFDRIDEAGAELVCLAGWLCLLDVPDRYAARVLNIHPSLLPSFGGRGMYGGRVHRAVLDRGCKVTGCTVHFVDNAYDTGPIVLQRPCPVRDGDTPETLAARVAGQERIAYPQAVRLFQQGRLRIDGRAVRVAPHTGGPRTDGGAGAAAERGRT